jgi:ATP-dependent DNA helicase RecG
MNSKIESQNIELKSVWKDEYLRQICGFSNADGGLMYIGVNDQGNVIGAENVKRLLEEIPNKAANLMGVILQVNLQYENGLPYISITVPKSSHPVSLRGKFYYRSGTTTQEMNGPALYSFLLKRNNLSWDEVGVETAKFDDIETGIVKKFVELAIDANRLTPEARVMNVPALFESLHLLDEFKHIR